MSLLTLLFLSLVAAVFRTGIDASSSTTYDCQNVSVWLQELSERMNASSANKMTSNPVINEDVTQMIADTGTKLMNKLMSITNQNVQIIKLLNENLDNCCSSYVNSGLSNKSTPSTENDFTNRTATSGESARYPQETEPIIRIRRVKGSKKSKTTLTKKYKVSKTIAKNKKPVGKAKKKANKKKKPSGKKKKSLISIQKLPNDPQYCYWLTEEKKVFTPLVMYKDEPLLYEDDNGKYVLRISKSTEVSLGCFGTGNLNEANKKQYVTVTCEGNDVLKITPNQASAGKTYRTKVASCRKKVIQEVIEKDKKNDIYAIGFQIASAKFYHVILFAADSLPLTTKWTFHILRGESLKASPTVPGRATWKSDSDLFDEVPVDAYKIANQKNQKLLATKIGQPIVGHKFFAKGHLTPVNDFATFIEKDATMMYENAVPQWHPYNMGDWKNLEMGINALARNTGNNYYIWTGAAEHTKNDIFIGVVKHAIQVPKFMWKLIYKKDQKLNEGIVAIMSNDPSMDKNVPIQCKDKKDLRDDVKFLHDFGVFDSSKGGIHFCYVKQAPDFIPLVQMMKSSFFGKWGPISHNLITKASALTGN